MFTIKRNLFAGSMLIFLILLFAIQAIATNGTITKELQYKDIKISLDGASLELKDAAGNPVEPFLFDGTNYLPVRAVAESLELNVAWDGETSTIVLTTPEERKPTYITATGKKWHNDPNCNGGTYWEVPYSSAVGMGLTPCDKCVH